jgi:CheY-like chemotaxis protein
MNPSVAREAEGRTSPSTLMVVEDDVLIRSAAADYLRGCGFVVVEAVDVPQAVSLLEADKSVELVFADIKLPGPQNGLDLVNILRRDHPRVRILLTSGVIKPDEAQLDDITLLRKPYFLFEVERHLKALLAGDTPSD